MEAGRKDPPHQGTAGGTQQRKNARRTGAKYDVQLSIATNIIFFFSSPRKHLSLKKM